MAMSEKIKPAIERKGREKKRKKDLGEERRRERYISIQAGICHYLYFVVGNEMNYDTTEETEVVAHTSHFSFLLQNESSNGFEPIEPKQKGMEKKKRKKKGEAEKRVLNGIEMEG